MKIETPATPDTDNQKSTGKLLSPEEWAIIKRLSTGQAPHSQHAQALLAVDQGMTQPEAARQSGLTAEQVRYWLKKFRTHRLTIFPKGLLDQPESEPASESSQELAETLKTPADLGEADNHPEKKSKKKKAGKGKKDRKGKPAKKAGKGKKKKKAKKPKKKGKRAKKSRKA